MDIKIETEDSHSLLEMASIGRLSDELVIRVFEEQSSIIPHIHLTKGSGPDWSFESCVCIEYNKYFVHKYKSAVIQSRSQKLNKLQMSELDSFLRSGSSISSITNWQYLLDAWNRNNVDSICKFSLTLTQPDFSKITDTQIEGV